MSEIPVSEELRGGICDTAAGEASLRQSVVQLSSSASDFTNPISTASLSASVGIDSVSEAVTAVDSHNVQLAVVSSDLGDPVPTASISSSIAHLTTGLGNSTVVTADSLNVSVMEESMISGRDGSDMSEAEADENLNAGTHVTQPLTGMVSGLAPRKRAKRPWSYETNPASRKRQQTRLLRKLKGTIDELAGRVGQQCVVIAASPGKAVTMPGTTDFKVFGAVPLEGIVKRHRDSIMHELEGLMQEHPVGSGDQDGKRHDLPPLVLDGTPTPLDKMTQAQLRAFIPLMLRYSTGRPKPGWGKEDLRPVWWPEGLPWQNVRADQRSDAEKQQTQWTEALRQIVRNCYTHHNRLDLLIDAADHSAPKPAIVQLPPDQSQGFVTDLDGQQHVGDHQAHVILDLGQHPHIIQHIQAADGTTMLLPQYLDGQVVVNLTEAAHSDQSAVGRLSTVSVSQADPLMTTAHGTSVTTLTDTDSVAAALIAGQDGLPVMTSSSDVLASTSAIMTTSSHSEPIVSMNGHPTEASSSSVSSEPVPAAAEAVEVMTLDQGGPPPHSSR